VYAFLEGGKLYTNKTLPAEKRSYDLASAGFGTRIRYLNHITGSVDLAMPLVSQPNALAHDLFLLFRLGMDF
jgi:hemolysin activation/secretion protein